MSEASGRVVTTQADDARDSDAGAGAAGRAYASLYGRLAAAGVSGDSLLDKLIAQLRTLRPMARLWADTIMPTSVLLVLTHGEAPAGTVALTVAVFVTVHAAAHILNDLEDVEVDRQSTEALRASRPIARGVISRRLAIAEAAVLIAVGLALAFVITPLFGVLAVGLTVILVLYEVNPVRPQTRGHVSQVYATLGIGLLMASLLTVVDDPAGADAAPFMAWVAIYIGSAYTLMKDVRDADNDARGGKLTAAVRHGAVRATRAGIVALALAGAVWTAFALTYPDPRPLPLAVAGALLVAWIACVARAATALERGYSKRVGVTLHRGTIAVFSCINLLTIAAIA